MKLTNLQAAIATRARQIAAGAIKQTAIARMQVRGFSNQRAPEGD